MATPVTASNLRLRRSYGKTDVTVDIPDLIELQRRSYANFLQHDVDMNKRNPVGLQGVFRSVFPITNFNKTCSLEFVGYSLEPPKYDVEDCRQRGMTFASPFKVTLRLVVFDVDESSDTRSIRDVKEQEIYLGEMPLMTASGSFIINGTERVVVSQLHRSPGVFFDHDQGKNTVSGKYIYSARVIPYRGSWLDIHFDQKDLLYVRIDRKRKFPATILLKALGYDTKELLEIFYEPDIITIGANGKIKKTLNIDKILSTRASGDIINPKTKEVIVKQGRRITRSVVSKVKELGMKECQIEREELLGKVLTDTVMDENTGEIISEANADITPEILEAIENAKIKTLKVIFFDGLTVSHSLRNTLLIDKIPNKEAALLDIYKRMRHGEPPTIKMAEAFFERMFFNPETYDLSEVGRLKFNHRFNTNDVPITHGTLRKEDIVLVVKTLIDLKNGIGQVDDIDHLGNRRIRSVGELLENQYRIGLVRMERSIMERMSLQDIETMMPHDLVNAKPVNAVVKEFFGSSQLSQFMDQTNPLAEITHKRRLSALGPGGLTRDRAGFEVRDVHPTHYGRICPVETPEGPNIGLIASLASFARINKYGFIETPYKAIENGKIKKKVQYLSAFEETGHHIAQSSGQDKLSTNSQGMVDVRLNGEYKTIAKDQVTLMDVSPSQLVSIAASLIPFLEHDDANRALMGSNMQRQAVPLMLTEAPLVGTGVERLVARDSGTSIVCRNDGEVVKVDASMIVVRRLAKGGGLGANVDIYNLIKYQRTNQNTCFNQKPIVKLGDRVKAGDIIADGPATELGELALGKNVIIAFAPWQGYNFEDSILLSETLIKEDAFTSIHIEEFECVARDTKLGSEEITRDIANVGEEALKDLDQSGVVRIGAEVKPGDVLVGKVTPKGETLLSPEEKLLRAIFGEKAGDVKDTSLRVPSGVMGTIIDAQVYSREPDEKDERLQYIIAQKKKKLKKDLGVEENVIRNNAFDKLKQILVGEKTTGELLNEDGTQNLLEKKQQITADDLEAIPFDLLSYIPLESSLEAEVSDVVNEARKQLEAIRVIFDDKSGRLDKGDELLPGVIKMVKVYVAIKRKLQVGDKFAGRHGNKGVVSKIVAEEDMPYMADGNPVDMILNPLGVPSRMNIGQILETHLGLAARTLSDGLDRFIKDFQAEAARKDLLEIFKDTEFESQIKSADDESIRNMIPYLRKGVHISSPVFDGVKEDEIKELFEKTGLPSNGQTVLFDGRTGEPFQNPITVGVMYMLKLHHLVEEKIHARAIGPYSLVSQQPLGGKAQFGGQRLGEMEVWAIEAYGAAYSLQEFLTVKSDDVAGRTRMYESIVKGENMLDAGLPESFNVLIKELQSLALNVDLLESNILGEESEVGMDEEDAIFQ